MKRVPGVTGPLGKMGNGGWLLGRKKRYRRERERRKTVASGHAAWEII